MLDLLWRIVTEEKLSMLCTLHQLELEQEYGDRILGMKAGRVEIDAPIAETDTAQLNALYTGMTRVDAQPTEAAA